MQNNTNKKLYIVAGIIILAAAAIAGSYIAKNRTPEVVWKSYSQKDFGLSLQYPSDWEMSGVVASNTPCCLFLVKYNISTTTTTNASGTPVTNVTATERVKLQIGTYDMKNGDPFGGATTTKVLLGKTEFLTGTLNGILFYQYPFSSTTGLGIATFAYPETPEDAKVLARKVVSTIELVAPTSTSTIR